MKSKFVSVQAEELTEM